MAVKKVAKKRTKCWEGYEPVSGKKPGAKGSCKKKAKRSF